MPNYEPEVNDYVVWDRGEYGKDEGWVYFKGDPVEPKKGFNTPARYITIETGVKDRPKEEIDCRSSLKHSKTHTLLLCYEQNWKELQFIRRRESKECEHYSQYDDRSGRE
jgi:hypothetical protein